MSDNMKRDAVLKHFGWQICHNGEQCEHDECAIPLRMADEIVRLRDRLAAVEAEAKEWRGSYMLVADSICASSEGPTDLAGQARQLRAERDALRKSCADAATIAAPHVMQSDTLPKMIQRMATQIEALRKDAARYRWLRDNKEQVAVYDIDMFYYLNGLDAYVDAALAVQP